MHDLSELSALTPRPDIRLIATDMDGTLLDDDREIHDEFWPLVDLLFTRGITFCPASGRHHLSLRNKFAAIADEVVLIASNGAHIIRGEDTYLANSLAPEAAAEVARRVRGVDDAWAVLCGVRSAYIEDDDPAFLERISPHYPQLALVPDLTTVDDQVLSVGIFDRLGAADNALPALSDLGGVVKLMATEPGWVDVVNLTADKGSAVRFLQERLGITPDQTMVFGDYLNDLEMMATAAYSFAMANAHPQLKALATWTAPTNSANGVVRTIRAVLGLL